MANEGYIKISRKLLDWEHGDNMAMIGFWVTLLLLASWEDKKKVRRGEFSITMPALAGICQCSESTVARYLQKLKATGEIETSTNHRTTKIRIVNYDLYQQTSKGKQSSKNDGTADRTADRTADKTGDDSYPYLKKEKKERNKEISILGKTSSQFKKPTLEEVQAYITENLYTVDAQRFMDYYESNGWQIGKNHMKDWKATVRNWERRNQEQFKKEKQKGQGWSFNDL